MLDTLAWAKRFIETPSVSNRGNAEIAAACVELLAEAGVEAQLIPAEHDGIRHYTVIGDLGPERADARPGLLLLTHLDTVPPGPAGAWTATGGDPWRATVCGDRLYGLGAADAKVDLVCKAAALDGIDASALRRPVRVVGTFGEEIGLRGARWLLESGHTRGFGEALVGEPSELVAIRAHKGYTCFEARVPLSPIDTRCGMRHQEEMEGMSAHSSTPHLGRSAIEAALERLRSPDLLGLIALEGGGPLNLVADRCRLTTVVRGDGPTPPEAVYDARPLHAFWLAWCRMLSRVAEAKDPAFDPDHTVGNLGSVRLRDGEAVLGFDLRPIPGVDAREAVESLADVADVQVTRSNPALATSPQSPLVRAITRAQQDLGLGQRLGTKATCTEAGLLSAAGLDAIVLGPGPSVGNVHRPNEYTRISELAQARDLYREIIRARCVEVEPCSC